MAPQLNIRAMLIVALAVDPLCDDFLLQFPFASQTNSFDSQIVPGALQSIGGKLGSPLLGLLFHWAETTAIKANTENNSSLFILLLTLSFYVRTTWRFETKWAATFFSFQLKSGETFRWCSLGKGFGAMFRFESRFSPFKCFDSPDVTSSLSSELFGVTLIPVKVNQLEPLTTNLTQALRLITRKNDVYVWVCRFRSEN